MRPRGINQILRMGVLGSAALLFVSGPGLSHGAVQGQKKGQPKLPPNLSADPLVDQPVLVADPVHVKMDEERMKLMNDDRHKRLAADVDRLIALTTELKTDVDKATKDELSLDVIKKAQEIEKLAHDVQSRMKN